MTFSDIFSFFKKGKKSKEEAKERLKFAIIYDRLNLSTDVVDKIKKEFIITLQKYIDIDEKGLNFEIVNKDRETAIVANIPIKPARRN